MDREIGKTLDVMTLDALMKLVTPVKGGRKEKWKKERKKNKDGGKKNFVKEFIEKRRKRSRRDGMGWMKDAGEGEEGHGMLAW